MATFKKPDELCEIVGKIVTSALEEKSGAESEGLRAWERAYLEFRIPAWRAGRTALGQPHLFDAEDSRELYQADLYTPLDGVSGQWRRDENGVPMRIVSTKSKRSALDFESSRRIRLARWLTVSDLPRLALVGAPGGGKTIFLTRAAAAVGSSCLGRLVDFEPELQVERLRRKNTLPIPVLLEATRIASRDCSSVACIIEAIADEIVSAGGLRPDAQLVQQGLKEGRYLLLIDALDEIADGTQRTKLLLCLKGIGSESVFSRTRIILTTRSARYTGRLSFGPEFESVEVAPLNKEQVRMLCANWSNNRQRDLEYKGLLMAAVEGLEQRVSGGKTDQALTGNPLMLTAICMVFERYRSLPDDRGRLCDLLIDDLCRSRRSEDLASGWKLDESGKKDLLQRIALAMQKEGAQTWPIGRAIEIAMQVVPSADGMRQLRAKRYVDWAADHTGILRFQEAKGEEEQIRFWHRLFREYLSANQIAQQDTTAEQKIDNLWNEGRLTDPFWEDVVRLLPRALGTIEKARSMRSRIETLQENGDANAYSARCR